MKKNRKMKLILAAFTGLLLFTPTRAAYVSEAVHAAQVSDTHDSKLSAFDIAPGTLSPAFSPDILEYTSTVDADVTDVRVQAVPRASGAVIASIEGRSGLHPGVNTIKATCSAQDNTFTVYTITLIVGSADGVSQQADSTQSNEGNAPDTQPGDTNTPDGQPDEGNVSDRQNGEEGTQPEEGDTPEGKTADAPAAESAQAAGLIGPVAADGTVILNGASYKLSSNFVYGATTQDIPSAFGQGSVQIGETNYSTLYCEANHMNLVYMENTDGNGSTGFYFYDEVQNAVERFKYTGIGDNFVVFISSARDELPTGYQETTLTLPSGKEVIAYQNLSSPDLDDYYLIYGLNQDGSAGWYLYDNTQGTYMRYSAAFASQGSEPEEDDEEEVARTVSLAKYNSLNEKYTELKKNRVRIVSVFAIALVVLLIIFTAILMRNRDDDEEDENEAPKRKRTSRKSSGQKKSKNHSGTISKSSLAAGRNFDASANKKTKKVTKTITGEASEEPRRQAAYQDSVSTPEEIRAQLSRETETTGPVSYAKKSQQRSLLKTQQTDSQESVQLAAERMRQSVKYSRKNPRPDQTEDVKEHDPMDDWDMDEVAGRKSQKANKASKAGRKRRSLGDEDIEIMDLNDL